ncbi:MAG: hypothetical protein LBD21_05495 [Tannerellaceae bacterium]|jgi:hypothetical protein|nr:hypothetical protein [Tannerellaceae bacterium]
MKAFFRFFIAFILLNAFTGALAASADPTPRRIKQADGTSLTVRSRGDEFMSWTESMSGNMIVKNKDGIFEYAALVKNAIVPSGVKATEEPAADELNFIKTISKEKLELMLCRNELQNVADMVNTKAVLRNLVSGYEKKAMYADIIQLGLRTNIYARAHVLSKMSKQSLDTLPDKDKNSVLFSGLPNGETMRIIDELSYKLIR